MDECVPVRSQIREFPTFESRTTSGVTPLQSGFSVSLRCTFLQQSTKCRAEPSPLVCGVASPIGIPDIAKQITSEFKSEVLHLSPFSTRLQRACFILPLTWRCVAKAFFLDVRKNAGHTPTTYPKVCGRSREVEHFLHGVSQEKTKGMDFKKI
jgi:hypothetical protein